MDKWEYEEIQKKLTEHLKRKKEQNKTKQIPYSEWMTEKEMVAYDKAIFVAKSILSNYNPSLKGSES